MTGNLTASGILPYEVMSMVVECLGVNTDRATLLALLRVSPACWDMAARSLYRNIDINAPRMASLLKRSSIAGDFTSRQRKARSFIQRLNLRNLDTRALQAFDIAALYGIPLFPKVEKVHIYDTHSDGDFKFPVWFSPTTVVFSSPAVCSWQHHRLNSHRLLQVDEIRHLSLHSEQFDSRAKPLFWQTPRSRATGFERNGPPTTLFYKSLDSIGLDRISRPSVGLRLDYGPNAPASHVQVWVGEYNTCFDAFRPPTRTISSGPWDASDGIQFRKDSDEFKVPPCPVCGGKGDLEGRDFGCTFTQAW